MTTNKLDTILQTLTREAELAGSGNVYASDSLPLYMADAKQAIEAYIAERIEEAYENGKMSGWAKNVKRSLCFEHEHDVRWCDECRGSNDENN